MTTWNNHVSHAHHINVVISTIDNKIQRLILKHDKPKNTALSITIIIRAILYIDGRNKCKNKKKLETQN